MIRVSVVVLVVVSTALTRRDQVLHSARVAITKSEEYFCEYPPSVEKNARNNRAYLKTTEGWKFWIGAGNVESARRREAFSGRGVLQAAFQKLPGQLQDTSSVQCGVKQLPQCFGKNANLLTERSCRTFL